MAWTKELQRLEDIIQIIIEKDDGGMIKTNDVLDTLIDWKIDMESELPTPEQYEAQGDYNDEEEIPF